MGEHAGRQPPRELQQALALYQQGAFDRAAARCESILAMQPQQAGALQILGLIAAQTGQPVRAIELLARSIRSAPQDAMTHFFKGAVHQQLGQWPEALACYDHAVALQPDHPQAHCHRGKALMKLRRWDAALASFDAAIEHSPNDADAHIHRGRALRQLGRWDVALASIDRGLVLRPGVAEAYVDRGNVLVLMEQWHEALASFEQAIRLAPNIAVAHYNRGNVLRQLKRHEAALACFENAIALDPNYANAFLNRGNTLVSLQRHEEAVTSYDRALALNPGLRFLPGTRLHACLHLCDWRNFAADFARIESAVERGEPACPPFSAIALLDRASLQKKAARTWVREICPTDLALPPIGKLPQMDRLRIGYFSADFHEHPVGILSAQLFELHDRSRFHITAFSFGPAKRDPIRARLESAFDEFVDVHERSERDIALLARNRLIDIAVDLSGFTDNCRTKIFALRAAPIQLAFLGYPGTLGADYIDYLIGDRITIPAGHREHYQEKIAYLPHGCLPCDNQREVAERAFGREELGLPPAGFVYCCFNKSYKITPDTFDSWMRILQRVDGSVLWLSAANATATANLRREAAARSVDPQRLVFAARTALASEHLARHRAADLFLDTLPYNAHATALDALWAGLPVLTRLGQSFAGRVAASLLDGVGLPELVTATAQEYEDTAVALAHQPQLAADLKAKLARNRAQAPLFDTRQFARHLESAYRQMYDRHRADLPPEHIDAAPL